MTGCGVSSRLLLFRVSVHQNVQILGCAGLRMDRYSIGADDKVPNAVRVQNGQEFSVV